VQAKGLTIPVSISYNTGGIRVSQIASDIGIGWNLNAGGSITRSMRGLPDDVYKIVQGDSLNKSEVGWLFADPNSYITNNGGSVVSNAANAVQYTNLLNNAQMRLMDMIETPDNNYGGKLDTEPDVFYINCGSIQGSFVFMPGDDEDAGVGHEVMLIPYQNIRVTYTLDQNNKNIDAFKVIDEDGTIYYFGTKETTRTNTRTLMMGYNPSTHSWPSLKAMGGSYHTSNYTGFNNSEYHARSIGEYSYTDSTDRTYVTSWFIDSIRTNLNQIILFQYEDEWRCQDKLYQKNYIIGSNYRDTCVTKIEINYFNNGGPDLK
jgi:hypothetical protein